MNRSTSDPDGQSNQVLPVVPILLSRIRIPAGATRPIDKGNVERLREVIREGKTFRDPPRVFAPPDTDGDFYFLSHGQHRIEAARLEKQQMIDVQVLHGKEADAIADACRPHNADNLGLPETIQVRNERVKLYVTTHPEASVRAISDWTGVPKSTVDRIRKEVRGGVPRGTPDRTIGRDGRSYPATQPKAALEVDRAHEEPMPHEKLEEALRGRPTAFVEVAPVSASFVCAECGSRDFEEDADGRYCASCKGGEAPPEPAVFNVALARAKLENAIFAQLDKWPTELRKEAALLLAQIARELG